MATSATTIAFSTIIAASSAASCFGLFAVAHRRRHQHYHCCNVSPLRGDRVYEKTLYRHRPSLTRIDLYRKFHDYAWDKLMSNNDGNKALLYDTVPVGLRTNTSPVKNASPGTNVVATIRSVSRFPFLELDRKVTDEGHKNDGSINNDWNLKVLRLSRTAFLETQTPTNEALITNMTIHVLNFVSFPSANIRHKSDSSNYSAKERYLGLPVFGADIVTLPGNKHLVALDFQPVLPLDKENEEGKSIYSLFPERYSLFEDRLRALHSKYHKSDNDSIAPLLAWGGDIPEKARRFFSPYALWTRLGDANAMDTVNTVVWEAFQEYTDLYMELMCAVQCDVDFGILEITHPLMTTINNNLVLKGQLDYLEYRRTNDPARPMLQRLYGKEWSESVIGDVLFPDL